MMASPALTVDVAVLGSGFGGSLSALILHRLGYRVAVFDRARHPRFTIGESSTPVADMILRDLCDRYDLPRLRPLWKYGTWQATYPALTCGLKRGFSYFRHEPGEDFVPRPDHANELLVAASRDEATSDTHWLRAEVDAFFAGEVRAAGIPLFEETAVTVYPDGTGWRLAGRNRAGNVRCRAGFVIDATGPAAVVPEALGLPAAPATAFRTNSRAVYGHFAGVPTWASRLTMRGANLADHPFPCDAAALHHLLEAAWMWMLRFRDGRLSAGLVLDARRHPSRPDRPPEDEWACRLHAYPALRELFATARVVDPPGRLVATPRLQRRWERVAGAGWALLPHTAGFVDPLHSTGIAHTLGGIERLMRAFERGPGHAHFPERLAAYERAVLAELSLIDGLVAVCYEALPDFRLFTAAAMLYFAATITYEQARARHGFDEAGYLFRAEDPALRRLVDEAHTRLARLRQGKRSEAVVRAFEAWVEAAIAPYNTAGLFHPPVPNMYHHTVAPLVEAEGLRAPGAGTSTAHPGQSRA
ncbi:MAG: halogenase [Rhodothermaceae bacterium]|nr:MAG: halogenase [Rhodothermaceae bacterium]